MSYLGRVPAAAPIDADDIPDNSITSAKIVDGAIAVADIADDAVGIGELSATGTASSTTFLRGDNSWVAPTDSTKLPLAGGTMTGSFTLNDNVKIQLGTSDDLQIYHDSSNSYILESGTGSLAIQSNGAGVFIEGIAGESSIVATSHGAVDLYYDNTKRFETLSTGVYVTGAARGTLTTDNDGSFDMSASNNFKCTPAGNFTLTFTNILSQSGFILLVNSGGHTVSAHANSKVDANLLATVTAAGTYLVSYFSDGTNVYLTNSAIYT
jgi:hypothetical protein